MKIFHSIFLILLVLAFSCKDGYIDEIKPVDPGPDETAPEVEITFPVEGTEIKVPEVTTTIEIKFEVTDDIEIASIKLSLDGTELATFTQFKDYRRVITAYVHEGLGDGNHKVEVEAVDTDGKTTSQELNFSKVPPYVPKYAGEIFYLPFDGDYTELISLRSADVVGNPGFAGESVVGLDAYAGAPDSYISFSTEALQTNQFSAVFWMKINAIPDRAGVLVMGPPDPDKPENQNNRNAGFRFFREAAGDKQRFKLNAGTGDTDSWFDGGDAADVDPASNQWVHLAFSISSTNASVYINGEVVSQGDFAGIDWTGCDILSIMSGHPRFVEWGHNSDESFMDELRLFNKALSQSEIQGIIADESGGSSYQPKYDGEVFYMPFEDDMMEKISGTAATEVGSPSFAAGRVGQAYAGTADSYVTFPTDNLKNNAFSAVFWMKLNADPDRAGVLVMGPPDEANPGYPDVQNLRTNGFRFFREDAAGMQRVKLNAGDGAADSWFDGGDAADVDPTLDEWVHYAFTISETECVVYINGTAVSQGAFAGIDWTGCDILSIMSGTPRFTEWGHGADQSLLDELRIFNKALSEQEIQAIIADET